MRRRNILRRISMYTTLNTRPGLVYVPVSSLTENFRKQRQLVLAWAELHQEELLVDWQRVMNGQEPFPIRPLH